MSDIISMRNTRILALLVLTSLLLFFVGVYYGWLAQTHIPRLDFYDNVSLALGISSYLMFGVAVAFGIWKLIAKRFKK